MAKILLVDDSSFQRRRVAKVVREAGHQVSEASNGKEGLALVASEPPDCVLVDLLMPEMDGLEFLAGIRENQAKVPVIVVTADIQEEIHKQCLELGALAIVNKPPKAEELQRWIGAALAAPEGAGAP